MKTKLLGLLAFMSLLGFSPVSADTIYTYTGKDFTFADGAYTTTDKVTGTIDLATALGDNFTGAITPVSFSFSDGVQTLTNSNSNMNVRNFSTDSSGAILHWNVEVDGFVFSSIFSYFIVEAALDFGGPVSLIGSSEGFNQSDPGSWTVSASSTPLPAALPLFAGGLGAIGLLSWWRKRKTGAPRAA